MQPFFVERESLFFIFVPKSTIYPDVKRTDVYFCADEAIKEYKQKYGKHMDGRAKEIIRNFGEFINEAYQDGYRDGMEDK